MQLQKSHQCILDRLLAMDEGWQSSVKVKDGADSYLIVKKTDSSFLVKWRDWSKQLKEQRSEGNTIMHISDLKDFVLTLNNPEITSKRAE